MASVEELGMQGASGVLEVTGNPSGAIYLEEGRITFAQASGVPGLAARLSGIRPVPAELREVLADQSGQGDAAIAAHIVQHGYLTRPGLHGLIQSIVIDAFLVLAIPPTGHCPLTAIRFTSTRGYWPEAFPRLAIGLVLTEAMRRAERLADCRLAPTTAVALQDLRLPVAVVTREQWAVACQISGPASAQELAQRCGIALADTVEYLDGLIRAGLCTPVRASGQRPAEPRRHYAGPVDPDRPARPHRPGGFHQPPSPEILLRVLYGLRKLS
jgi:hypothetical protein